MLTLIAASICTSVDDMQTRLSAEFVGELEGILGEHEGDLEMNVQRSPKPGQAGPVFPAMMIHKLINHHILVRLFLCYCHAVA